MQRSGTATVGVLLTMVAGLVIGSVSFSGSMIAFAKLQGIMKKNIRLPFYNIINILLMLGIVVLSAMIVAQISADPYPSFYGVSALSLVSGILFLIFFGGPPMPFI